MDENQKKILNTMFEIIEYEVNEIKVKSDEVKEFLFLLKNEDIDFDSMSMLIKFIKSRYKFVHDIFESIEGITLTKSVEESYNQFQSNLEKHLEDNKYFSIQVNNALSKVSVKH